MSEKGTGHGLLVQSRQMPIGVIIVFFISENFKLSKNN